MLAKKIIMYSSLTLLKKYLQYLLKASNGKGHGVHSPFVFSFIREVLNAKVSNPKISLIEKQRSLLEGNKQMVQVWDRGAGSRQTNNTERSISQIAKAALKPKKYSQLLYKIIAYYKPSSVLEMGTSLGITTCYLAIANPIATIVTMEGASNVAAIAKNTFKEVGVPNIQIIEGDFDKTLAQYLNTVEQVGIAYVDGNHRYEPTIRYFESLANKSGEHSILIFDDIHWSAEMEKAWEEIKRNPAVTLTIDLFFIGLVFIREAQKQKEHFTIRY
jgi:predicted O-methyltransferase YrrM